MFEKLAIFDLGKYSLKCIFAKTGFKSFEIEHITEVLLNQEIEDENARAKVAIEKIISTTNIEEYSIITNFPSDKMFIYILEFPFTDKQQIKNVIHYELADNLPIDIENTYYEFQIIEKEKGNSKVIATVVKKDDLTNFINIFKDLNLSLHFIGCEFNSLFQLYTSNNTVIEESILLVNFGYNKTIINFVDNSKLESTRIINWGFKNIFEIIQSYYNDEVFEILHYIDFNSFENNINKEIHSKLNISKQKFKKIYNNINSELKDISSEILLFIEHEYQKSKSLNINRVLLSGGCINYNGFSSTISQFLQLPVVNQSVFQSSVNEIKPQFYLSLGILYDYLNHKKYSTINLLSFFKELSYSKIKKTYMISIVFGFLSIIALFLYLTLTGIYYYNISQNFDKILIKKYRSYFLTSNVPDDPIADAQMKLNKLQKQVNSIESFLKMDIKFTEILYNIASNFPNDETFLLKNIVINETVIRIDGETSSSQKLDDFKNRLTKTNLFDSVILNTNLRKNNIINFNMTIKLKVQNKGK